MLSLKWYFLEKKTKTIIYLSLIYLVLTAILVFFEILSLRLYLFNSVIIPTATIALMTLIFTFLTCSILIIYELKWYIKTLLSGIMLVSTFLIAYFFIYFAIFNPQTIKIEVTDEIDIVVLETSIRFSSEQSFYIIENGVSLKFLVSTNTFRSSLKNGNYRVDVYNERFTIVFDKSDIEIIILHFDLIDGEVVYNRTQIYER